jgi:threonine synthase
MHYIKHAVCIDCGQEIAADPNLTVCPVCGGLTDIVYDYAAISRELNRDTLAARAERSMWRYQELLPLLPQTAAHMAEHGLRVGNSPLYRADNLARELGLAALYIKDDGQNPTASLKDRASALAVAKAREAGQDTIACSSTGNAASSLAGNCARAGMTSYIFVPERAPKGKIAQLLIFGANVFAVRGDYGATFRLSARMIEQHGWYNRNAAINPYLLEGKKTVALELAEQLNWQLPDYVAVSVGDGCTIAGVWKGFTDLYQLGLIQRLPRLISVQAEGCCPLNLAHTNGQPWQPMAENTLADSIAVGVPRNAKKALAALRDSNAVAVNVSDEEILAAMRLLGRSCGVFGEPAGVAALAGVVKARREEMIPASAEVAYIVTGNGLKDVANGIKAAGEPNYVEAD